MKVRSEICVVLEALVARNEFVESLRRSHRGSTCVSGREGCRNLRDLRELRDSTGQKRGDHDRKRQFYYAH
jgi:hypothetical protein